MQTAPSTRDEAAPLIRYCGEAWSSRGRATRAVQSDGTVTWIRKTRTDQGVDASAADRVTNSNTAHCNRARSRRALYRLSVDSNPRPDRVRVRISRGSEGPQWLAPTNLPMDFSNSSAEKFATLLGPFAMSTN